MKRVGIDLGTLSDKAPPKLETDPDCPGAALRVNHEMLRGYRQGGEQFRPMKDPLPSNGFGDVRVYCTNSVARLPSTASGFTQFYGLCHSCSSLEALNREALRQLQGAK